MEKNGMLTKESISDFNNTKKAEYFDLEGFETADEANKNKLKSPQKIENLKETEFND
jgi:hypothetical protein